MAKEKLKAAVIGVGNMGKHHARVYASLEGVRLVAVCDIDERAGSEIAGKFACNYYNDHRAMLSREKPDVVSVAVPTKMHSRAAVDALNAGAHVLVEKPIADTLAQARRIIDAAKKNNRKLTVGHIERFNPAVRKVKEMIDRGKLGTITSIIAKRVGPFVSRINGNVVIDLAVHDIDIINYLLGDEPRKIYANGGKALSDAKEDYAELFLKYGSASGYVQVNWITPVLIRELHVTGTKGYVQANYITQEVDFYQAKYEKEFDDFGDFVIKFGTPKKESVPVERVEPLKVELQSFVDSIINDAIPSVTARDGIKALETALKALKSIQHA